MGDLVISDLDTQVLTRISQRAALHGRAVEGEAQAILSEAVRNEAGGPWAAFDAIRRRLEASNRSFSDSLERLREDRER